MAKRALQAFYLAASVVPTTAEKRLVAKRHAQRQWNRF